MLLEDVHIMVIILIFLLILIVKLHISLGDVRLENFVRAWWQNRPLVFRLLEIIAANIDIAVADADVVAFGFEHSRYLSKHLSAVLAGIGSTQN